MGGTQDRSRWSSTRRRRRQAGSLDVDGEETEMEEDDDGDVRMGSDTDSDVAERRGRRARGSCASLRSTSGHSRMRQPLNERYHLVVRLRKKYCLDTLKFNRYIEEGDEDGAALT